MKLLLIIPAYNECESIERVVENLRVNFPQYDYVVINDGSTDDTSQICHEHGYEVIDHPVNLGLAAALQTGMRYACEKDYDAAMQLDADGQHRPEYISSMLAKMEEGYDIVIGSRFVERKKPHTLRMLGSGLISAAIRIVTGKRIKDPTSGMRLYDRKVIRILAKNINYGPEPDTISFLLKKGMKVAEVQVEMSEREAGTSYLTLGKSVNYMVRMLISILIIQAARKR